MCLLSCLLGNVACVGQEPLNSKRDYICLRFMQELEPAERLTEKVQQKLETSSLFFSNTF